jgi:hypothetical protein
LNPPQVYAYAQGMYTLAADAAKARRPAAAAAFRSALATAAARAAGARCAPACAPPASWPLYNLVYSTSWHWLLG